MPGQAGHDGRTLLHSPFLQPPLILFLGATALAAPLGPEDVATELPDSIQYSFYCHKLNNSSGLLDLQQLSYSAFKTAKAFSISSNLTVPPHMHGAYSWVMPAGPSRRNVSRSQYTNEDEQPIAIHHIADGFTFISGLLMVLPI